MKKVKPEKCPVSRLFKKKTHLFYQQVELQNTKDHILFTQN